MFAKNESSASVAFPVEEDYTQYETGIFRISTYHDGSAKWTITFANGSVWSRKRVFTEKDAKELGVNTPTDAAKVAIDNYLGLCMKKHERSRKWTVPVVFNSRGLPTELFDYNVPTVIKTI
tara:strand:- start:53 stop:415 length:363 start_codon:yes stop_codon:yes gene_type:complete